MPKKPQTKTRRFQLKKQLLRPVKRLQILRARRTHKSFALTRRRDIPKRPELPGYIAFTRAVCKTVWRFRQQFAVLLIVYVLATLILTGVSQQSEYRDIADVVGQVGDESGLDALTRIGELFGATVLGALNGNLTEIQQFYLAVFYALMWLVMVWLLRQLLAGNSVRVRDGLYNAGAPFISTILIVMLMLLQATPAALGAMIFATATTMGVLAGVVGMMFGVAALVLVVLSFYWLTSSFFALVIVTLPGTYPMQAVRGASDIALGRRTALLFRLLWLVVLLLLVWAVVLLPVLLFDNWMQISWLPLVGVAVQVASGLSFIFGVTYIFLLYRKMIDDPAK